MSVLLAANTTSTNTILLRYYKKYNNVQNSALSNFSVGYSQPGKMLAGVIHQESCCVVLWFESKRSPHVGIPSCDQEWQSGSQELEDG